MWSWCTRAGEHSWIFTNPDTKTSSPSGAQMVWEWIRWGEHSKLNSKMRTFFRAGNSFGPWATKPTVHRCPGFSQQKAELQGQGELLLSGGHHFHLVQLGGGHVVLLVQLSGGHVLQLALRCSTSTQVGQPGSQRQPWSRTPGLVTECLYTKSQPCQLANPNTRPHNSHQLQANMGGSYKISFSRFYFYCQGVYNMNAMYNLKKLGELDLCTIEYNIKWNGSDVIVIFIKSLSLSSKLAILCKSKHVQCTVQ